MGGAVHTHLDIYRSLLQVSIYIIVTFRASQAPTNNSPGLLMGDAAHAHLDSHVNTETHSAFSVVAKQGVWIFVRAATLCKTLQHTILRCNTLQHTATHCKTST